MKRLNLSGLVDEHFAGHGNWQGLSVGKVLTGWLSYLLSQGDHRLNQVEAWAAGLSSTLQHSLAPTVRSLDFSDDRLERVLDRLSDDPQWDAFEGALNCHTVRVYDLKVSCVRLDTTTSSGYRPVEGEGLFQFGHSKDYRPDLPQVKISQAALESIRDAGEHHNSEWQSSRRPVVHTRDQESPTESGDKRVDLRRR